MAGILVKSPNPIKSWGYEPCLGRASASLLRLVRLSAPSWFRMPGSISVSCLVSAWPVMVNVLAASEACTLGLLKWMTVPWFVNMLTWKRQSPYKNSTSTDSHADVENTPLRYRRCCLHQVSLRRTGASCRLRLLFCVRPSSFCEHFPMRIKHVSVESHRSFLMAPLG